jgi:hypothetical protein
MQRQMLQACPAHSCYGLVRRFAEDTKGRRVRHQYHDSLTLVANDVESDATGCHAAATFRRCILELVVMFCHEPVSFAALPVTSS